MNTIFCSVVRKNTKSFPKNLYIFEKCCIFAVAKPIPEGVRGGNKHISIMKRLILFALSILFTVSTFAAAAVDVIVTNDAKKINAKILEVSQTEIKYKEADHIGGPTFTLSTADISSIIYANGKVAVFNEAKPSQQANDADEIDAAILKSDGEIIRGKVLLMSDEMVVYTAEGLRKTLYANQLDQVVTTYGLSKFYRNQPVANGFGANKQNAAVAQNGANSDQHPAWDPRYGGYIEFGGYVGEKYSYPQGGVVMDIVNGCRFNDYAFAGIGFGLYNNFTTVYSYYGGKDFAYKLGIPIYLDLRASLPTKKKVTPFFGIAVGPKIDVLTLADSFDSTDPYVCAFYRMNLGFDVKHFTMSVGYQMEGKDGNYDHFFDLRFGARLGR